METEIDFIYWNEFKSKLKQKYPVLTNADLLWRNGTREELVRMIAFKLGKTRRELEAIIEKG
jgi:hypothetical protein